MQSFEEILTYFMKFHNTYNFSMRSFKQSPMQNTRESTRGEGEGKSQSYLFSPLRNPFYMLCLLLLCMKSEFILNILFLYLVCCFGEINCYLILILQQRYQSKVDLQGLQIIVFEKAGCSVKCMVKRSHPF